MERQGEAAARTSGQAIRTAGDTSEGHFPLGGGAHVHPLGGQDSEGLRVSQSPAPPPQSHRGSAGPPQPQPRPEDTRGGHLHWQNVLALVLPLCPLLQFTPASPRKELTDPGGRGPSGTALCVCGGGVVFTKDKCQCVFPMTLCIYLTTKGHMLPGEHLRRRWEAAHCPRGWHLWSPAP